MLLDGPLKACRHQIDVIVIVGGGLQIAFVRWIDGMVLLLLVCQELGGVMDKLEATLASVQKNDAMALSALDNCRDGLKAEADGRERLLVQMKEVSKMWRHQGHLVCFHIRILWSLLSYCIAVRGVLL